MNTDTNPPSDSLQRAIERRATEFELPALIALLRQHFPKRAIRFESHPSRSLEPTLVRSVAFLGDAVTIRLSLGLFSVTSPLPAYFQDMLEHPTAGPSLAALLATVNDALLADRSFALSPLAADRAERRLPSMRKSVLALSRPGSLIGLHWLFRHVFPELTVTVRRAGVPRRMPAPDVLLGGAVLGVAALGGQALLVSPGFEVFLTTVETTTWSHEPWTQEARRRISSHVLPALGKTGVNLRVVLLDHDGQGRLVLHQSCELGFHPMAREPSSVAVGLTSTQ